MNLNQAKQRFGIIGNSPLLNRALEIAIQVAPTDLSVLITGESGSGKEAMPQIIHHASARKHNEYIAVNCGAIPEGTIDSELFGHEKGSFTGAIDARKGYFEEANGGTIFLDEVAELPMSTQARLLRVLETGEYIRVGASKVKKTNVRIIAATNVDIPHAIKKGKFREDLYYRLNTVPVRIPSLRERKEDIHLLFRKFAADFSDKYKMPAVRLSEDAIDLLESYRWPGNIRQLKNITEQLSVIEQERYITSDVLIRYIPQDAPGGLAKIGQDSQAEFSDRDILYKVLFDMRNDINDLKALVLEIIQSGRDLDGEGQELIRKVYDTYPGADLPKALPLPASSVSSKLDYEEEEQFLDHEEVEESLSLEDQEKELIRKALEKYNGKRKYAAQELGISERTLYRKIKEYNI
jgi:transcriptional regulator with PAS, ATPase and Fis domain